MTTFFYSASTAGVCLLLGACTVVVHVAGNVIMDSSLQYTVSSQESYAVEQTSPPPPPPPVPKSAPSVITKIIERQAHTCPVFTLPKLLSRPSLPQAVLQSTDQATVDRALAEHIKALSATINSNSRAVTAAYEQYRRACPGAK